MEERVDEIDVFVVGIWFRSQMECIEFATKDIPEGLFQWSIEIVGYLQFVTGETVYTADSQRDKVHASKVSFKKYRSIFISSFKNICASNIGDIKLGEGVEDSLHCNQKSRILELSQWIKRGVISRLKVLRG